MMKYVVLGAQTQNNVIKSCTKIVVSLRCCVLCMCVNRSFHARQISGFADGAKLIWKSSNLYGGGDRFPVQGHSCWSASLVRVKWPLLTCTDNVATESRTHPLCYGFLRMFTDVCWILWFVIWFHVMFVIFDMILYDFHTFLHDLIRISAFLHDFTRV